MTKIKRKNLSINMTVGIDITKTCNVIEMLLKCFEMFDILGA